MPATGWNNALNIRKLDSEIRALEEKITQRTLRTPCDEITLIRTNNPGELAGKGKPVMEIAGDSRMVFSARVDQSPRRDLRAGQKAEIYLDN